MPQAQGGKHELWNVTLLCSGHHAALHDGLLVMQGHAPYQIQVRWIYGPPLPVGLDHETRQAMIRERIAEIFERTSEAASATAIPGRAGTTRPTWDGAPAGFT